MRLPNKAIPYSKSILARFPQILEIVSQQDIAPDALLQLVSTANEDLADYLSALDCLYALGKIEFTEEGGMLHYVDQN